MILFCSKGKRFEELYKFFNIVALIEDLEKDRLIMRLSIGQPSGFFVGELFDMKEEVDAEGRTQYVSISTGNYLINGDWTHLYNRWGGDTEILDPIGFDDPLIYDRLSKAFSGLVYPREALKVLVKNRFQSSEERRHRHAMTAAWTAIAISLIFSSVSLVISL